MADEKDKKQEAEPKKAKKAKGGKKSKLPVLVALIAVLGGGGFFGMKMAGGNKHEEPKLALGDETHVLDLGEYMVNTADGQTFLKAKVVVHLAEGTSLFGEGGHGDKPGVEAMAPYVDCVREVLSSQSVANLTTSAGEEELKVQLAEKVNLLFKKRNPKAKVPKAHEPNENWQSQSGPVLVVYLTELIWEN
jgi:flagellar basal body-associated protein FliL